MEVDADAGAVCEEDQCGEIGDGEGGGKEWKGFDRRGRGKAHEGDALIRFRANTSSGLSG